MYNNIHAYVLCDSFYCIVLCDSFYCIVLCDSFYCIVLCDSFYCIVLCDSFYCIVLVYLYSIVSPLQTLFIECTVHHTTEAFPGVMRWFEVSKTDSVSTRDYTINPSTF